MSSPEVIKTEKEADGSQQSLKVENAENETANAPAPKDYRFWLIMLSLLLSTFLAALDLTAITTALPTIAGALKSTDFAWIGNSYSITSTAVVPWSGGLAHVFGRRPVLLTGTAFFFVGSAICGASIDMDMMLAGRSLQGVGAGVILSLTEIVLADLVPLAERGAYQGAFGAIWALASAVGPTIGGALAGANWHWLFYLNLPLTGIAFFITLFFLDLRAPEGTFSEKIKRIDWIGNALFIPSVTIFIIGLVWGGEQYAWNSYQVLITLILGGVGLIGWYFVERYVVKYPTVPFKLLQDFTTTLGFFTTFLHGLVALAVFYFWPTYFQSVQLYSPVQSSVQLFTVTFIVAPFAMIAGGVISATQIYKPINIVAWVCMTLGAGLLYIVDANSSHSLQLGLPIIFAVGIGILFPATTFPVLAPLPPSLAGQALAFLVFVRNFGNIFGITVGSTVLTNELNKRLPQAFLSSIPGGVSSAFSAIPIIPTLSEPIQTQVRVAFADSIKVIWLVMIPISFVGLVASLFIKQMPLNNVTDETWGMTHRTKTVDSDINA